MTTIIGVENKGKVVMGADSECVNGWMRHTSTNRKIVRFDEMLIGVAGQQRTLNLVQHTLQLPSHPENESDEHFVMASLMTALRQCFKDNGWLTIENSQEMVSGNEFLIAYRGKVYRVGPAFDVVHYESGIAGIGSGDQYALGAIHALRADGKRTYSEAQVKDQIKTALAISAQLSMGVSEPFYVESI